MRLRWSIDDSLQEILHPDRGSTNGTEPASDQFALIVSAFPQFSTVQRHRNKNRTSEMLEISGAMLRQNGQIPGHVFGLFIFEGMNKSADRSLKKAGRATHSIGGSEV